MSFLACPSLLSRRRATRCSSLATSTGMAYIHTSCTCLVACLSASVPCATYHAPIRILLQLWATVHFCSTTDRYLLKAIAAGSRCVCFGSLFVPLLVAPVARHTETTRHVIVICSNCLCCRRFCLLFWRWWFCWCCCWWWRCGSARRLLVLPCRFRLVFALQRCAFSSFRA